MSDHASGRRFIRATRRERKNDTHLSGWTVCAQAKRTTAATRRRMSPVARNCDGKFSSWRSLLDAGDKAARVAAAPRKSQSRFQMNVPADGPGLPFGGSGDFGTSPLVASLGTRRA